MKAARKETRGARRPPREKDRGKGHGSQGVIARLETELMLEANNLPRGLSAMDRLYVVACDHYIWTLVTNDRALRNVCKDRGIRLRRVSAAVGLPRPRTS